MTQWDPNILAKVHNTLARNRLSSPGRALASPPRSDQGLQHPCHGGEDWPSNHSAVDGEEEIGAASVPSAEADGGRRRYARPGGPSLQRDRAGGDWRRSKKEA